MKRNMKLEVVEFRGRWGGEDDESENPKIHHITDMDLDGIEIAKTILNRKLWKAVR
jgi:hypothetical protein